MSKLNLKSFSTKDLLYLQNNDLSKMSTEALMAIQQTGNKISPDANNSFVSVDNLRMPDMNAPTPSQTGEDANNFKPALQEAPGIGKRFLEGMADPFVGAAQLAEKGYEKVVGKPVQGYSMSDYAKDREYQNVEGIDFARIGGNIANPANFFLASKIPAAKTFTGKLGLGGLTGAGFSATAPVTGEDYTKEKMDQIKAGGVVGTLFPVAGSAISRVISPKASTNPQIKKLQSEGIYPTPGELMGGRTKSIEDFAVNIPFIGDIIAANKSGNINKFRTSIFNDALSPIGEKIPKGLSGRKAVEWTKDKLSKQYTNVLNKIGAVKVDNIFNTQADEISTMINKSDMPEEALQEFSFVFNQIKNSQNKDGYVTSEAFKEIESSLSKQIMQFGRSDKAWSGKLQQATRQLKNNLSDQLERHAQLKSNQQNKNILPGNKKPEDSLSKQLADINKSWNRYKIIEKSAQKIDDSGNFTPSDFARGVKASDKSKDKTKFATGKATSQDMAEAGTDILGKGIPAITNQLVRAIMYGGAGVGAFANPGSLLALGGTGLIYNPATIRMINELVTRRPEIAGLLSQGVQKSVPYATSSTPTLLDDI
tara:strand:- start:18 stop:1799 length:1782 start_codon:yes stop_codon:yes gene_type:complete